MPISRPIQNHFLIWPKCFFAVRHGSTRPCPKADDGGANLALHHAHWTSARRKDDVVPRTVLAASLRITGSPGRAGIRNRRPALLPGRAAGRCGSRRDPESAGSTLLPAGHHRCEPGAGSLDSRRSQDLSLLESVSQSLAGRTAVHNLLPLTRGETQRFPRHPETLNETLFTGSLSAHIQRKSKCLGLARLLRRHQYRTRRADGQQCGRSRHLPALRCALRGPDGATAQLFIARGRLRHLATDGEGLAQHS